MPDKERMEAWDDGSNNAQSKLVHIWCGQIGQYNSMVYRTDSLLENCQIRAWIARRQISDVMKRDPLLRLEKKVADMHVAVMSVEVDVIISGLDIWRVYVLAICWPAEM